MADDIIHFECQRDIEFRRELGQGACGRTVLLYDDMIGEQSVCKKYTAYDERRRDELFENFKREIKILHLLHHANIVVYSTTSSILRAMQATSSWSL